MGETTITARRRTSIRIGESGEVSQQERIKACAQAQQASFRQEHEQIKMEVGVQAFVHGTTKDSREFIELERLAILTSQHERICKQLAITAQHRKNREMKICALTIAALLTFVVAVVTFVVRMQ